MIPDTHRVLLKTMLQYEIDNYIDPKTKKDDNELRWFVREYLVKRIKELDE